jgi:transposase
MPAQPPYCRQGLDHLGLVAGMCDALGLGEVIAQATQPHPARRDLPVGEAVKAMGRNGLGFLNQGRSRVPRCFPKKPTSRHLAPRVAPEQLHDDAVGRALETRDDYGVTALYSLRAATAAQRLGLAPRVAPRDRTSLHGDGRSKSEEEPEAEVLHSTRGSSRDQRPELHQVMLEVLVEPQAGRPLLRKALRGQSQDAPECGQGVQDPMAQ